MKPLVVTVFCILLSGCLNEPPTPRTVDINTLTRRESDQLLNNIESGVTTNVTITGLFRVGDLR